MVTRADFTDEEWATIYQSPAMAGMVVMTAGKSGPIQAMQEMFAVGKALADAAQHPQLNGLINAIVEAAKAKQTIEPPAQPDTVEQARAMALDHLRQTAVLADAKAPDEAEVFKTWLADIAQRVAEASKEGGFLGFGGTKVTEEEVASLQELRTALGLTSGA